MRQKPFHKYLIRGLEDGSLLLESVLAEVKRVIVPEKHRAGVYAAFEGACDEALDEALKHLDIEKGDLTKFEGSPAFPNTLPRAFHEDLIAGLLNGTMAIVLVLGRLEKIKVPEDQCLQVGVAFFQCIEHFKAEVKEQLGLGGLAGR